MTLPEVAVFGMPPNTLVAVYVQVSLSADFRRKPGRKRRIL
jgi:hypothetical protein